MIYQHVLNTTCFQANSGAKLTLPALAFYPLELVAVWSNRTLIKLSSAPRVGRCFPAVSEVAIMTSLLMTLERFPLKTDQGHLSFSTGGEVECASCLHNLLCQLSACKTRAALSHVMSGMWELNNCLGTGSPCKAIFKTCFGKKERSLTCLFPANICFEIEEACFMEYSEVYTDNITWGHGTGWKPLKNRNQKACKDMQCLQRWEKQECSNNCSNRRNGIIHRPATTDTGIKLYYMERKNPWLLLTRGHH